MINFKEVLVKHQKWLNGGVPMVKEQTSEEQTLEEQTSAEQTSAEQLTYRIFR